MQLASGKSCCLRANSQWQREVVVVLLWLTFTALFDVAVRSVLNPWLDGPRALEQIFHFISFRFSFHSIVFCLPWGGDL